MATTEQLLMEYAGAEEAYTASVDERGDVSDDSQRAYDDRMRELARRMAIKLTAIQAALEPAEELLERWHTVSPFDSLIVADDLALVLASVATIANR
jgi:hypothetical protein